MLALTLLTVKIILIQEMRTKLLSILLYQRDRIMSVFKPNTCRDYLKNRLSVERLENRKLLAGDN